MGFYPKSGEEIEVALSRGRSKTVNAYRGEVESLKSGSSQGVGIRIIIDGCEGFASAGSLDPEIVLEVVNEARQNLTFAEKDPHQAIATPDGIESPRLNLFDSSLIGISEDE